MSNSNEQMIQAISIPSQSFQSSQPISVPQVQVSQVPQAPQVEEENASVIQHALSIKTNRKDLLCVGTLTGFCKESEMVNTLTNVNSSGKKKFQLEIKIECKGEIDTHYRNNFLDSKQLQKILSSIKEQLKQE